VDADLEVDAVDDVDAVDIGRREFTRFGLTVSGISTGGCCHGGCYEKK
jgi:hypothetical protein